MPYDAIFRPLRIGNVGLRNRIARTAHHTGLPWSDDPVELSAYHVARAKGGVALSILQTGGVHPSSATTIPVYDDRVLRGYERLVGAVRPHGMRLFQQLNHQGSAMASNALGGPPWSASTVPNPEVGVIPRSMTKGEIDEMVWAFARAAARARDGGLDGVEVHAAHGYLVGQFLSPLTNHREDEYGGTQENRNRFLFDILAAVRAEVGDNFPVGVRLNSEERVSGGLDVAQWRDIALLAEPFVDYVNLSYSTYYRLGDIVASMEAPLGYELESSTAVRAAIGVPKLVTGRIMTLEHADQLVAEGEADLVSMVRALIADPELVAKTAAGRESQVRPCTGSNQGCAVSIAMGRRLECVVNPHVAREAETIDPPAVDDVTPRKVVVVGGGPAGLEAARVAAGLGHHVVLMEAGRELGGQVRIAARGPGRGDNLAVVDWLADEVGRLGVDVRLRTYGEPENIAAEQPDVVIVATGASVRADQRQTARPIWEIDGRSLPHVTSAWELLSGRFGGAPPRGPVCPEYLAALVYDDTGGFEALSAAHELLDRGYDVTFATRFGAPGGLMPVRSLTTQFARQRLAEGRCSTIGDAFVAEIRPSEVVLGSVLATADVVVPASVVVLALRPEPEREVHEALLDQLTSAGGPEVHLIGDAGSEVPPGHGMKHAIAAANQLASRL